MCAAKAREIQAKGNLASSPLWGALLDTKGPEIRTAMLRDHKSIDLVAGQTITVEAVGDRYTVRQSQKTELVTPIYALGADLCVGCGFMLGVRIVWFGCTFMARFTTVSTSHQHIPHNIDGT